MVDLHIVGELARWVLSISISCMFVKVQKCCYGPFIH